MQLSKLKLTEIEMTVCVGASALHVVLGFIFSIGIFVDKTVNGVIRKQERITRKLLCLSIVKLFILLLYPITILVLTEYQSLFISSILFNIKPQPIDGFAAAFVLFILHSTVNEKLYGDQACGP